jgi:hypothetical protein
MPAFSPATTAAATGGRGEAFARRIRLRRYFLQSEYFCTNYEESEYLMNKTR